jgi:hypothetical protein
LLASDPKQRFLFAGNVVGGVASVESFTLDAATGSVIVPAGQALLPGFSLTALCADPLGRFLYAAFAGNAQNGIAVFWVNPGGTLELINVLDTTNAVAQLVASSQGDALVFADGSTLMTFTVDSLTGALTLSAQLPGIDASSGLAVFENPSASPFVTLFAGGNSLNAIFGASLQLGAVNGSLDPGSSGLVVDRTGQSIYYVDGNTGLSSQIIPASITDSFSPDFTDYQTLPVPPSAIIYFDAWEGMSAG